MVFVYLDIGGLSIAIFHRGKHNDGLSPEVFKSGLKTLSLYIFFNCKSLNEFEIRIQLK